MEYRYVVIYRDYTGRFYKKIIILYSDWYNCVRDILDKLGCNIADLISISIDTNPPVCTEVEQ